MWDSLPRPLRNEWDSLPRPLRNEWDSLPCPLRNELAEELPFLFASAAEQGIGEQSQQHGCRARFRHHVDSLDRKRRSARRCR